jgi:hypothetical protein
MSVTPLSEARASSLRRLAGSVAGISRRQARPLPSKGEPQRTALAQWWVAGGPLTPPVVSARRGRAGPPRCPVHLLLPGPHAGAQRRPGWRVPPRLYLRLHAHIQWTGAVGVASHGLSRSPQVVPLAHQGLQPTIAHGRPPLDSRPALATISSVSSRQSRHEQTGALVALCVTGARSASNVIARLVYRRSGRPLIWQPRC